MSLCRVWSLFRIYKQGGAPPFGPALLLRPKVGKSLLRGSVPLRLPQTVPAESCFSINDSTLICTFIPGQKWVGVPLNQLRRKLSNYVPLKHHRWFKNLLAPVGSDIMGFQALLKADRWKSIRGELLALLATAVSVLRGQDYAVCARRDELSYYADKFKIKLLCRFVITPFSQKFSGIFAMRRSSENLQSCYFSDLAPMIKMHFCYICSAFL